jgi:autotransporter-associated beta strand protein
MDFFKFTLQQSLDVSLALTPQGTTYMVGDQGATQASFNTATLSDLTLSLISGNGSTVLATANLGGLGVGESIVRQLDPGDYYAKVTGAQNNIQLYKLLISGLTPAAEELIWMGSVNNQWDVGATANFVNRDGAEEFQNGDSVWFDNRATARDVTIAENVSPEMITIATEADSEFVFSGLGGIVGGSLTANGSGRVELANSGNSYSGATQVTGGTLAITGDAGAMVSAIEVGSGATLVLDPLDAGAMASTITVSAGGTLQIGATASERNVFPDSPAGVVNEGIVRILDSERISGVSGAGELVAEQAGIELADNGGFNGLVTVKSGGSVDVTDALGLGADVQPTVVEGGGSVRVNLEGDLTERFTLTGNGGGPGALSFAEGRNLDLLAEVSLTGGEVAIGVEQSADIEITRFVPAAATAELTLDVAESALLQLNNGVSLAGGGLTKRGPGAAAVRGSVMAISGANVQEGRLLLGASGDFDGEFQVALNAVLEFNEPTTFSEASLLAGAGQVAGDVLTAGTIGPGPDAARLEFTGSLALAPTSLVQLEAGGLAAGATYDDLLVFGSATLGGTLELTLDDGFVPTAGDMFELLHAGEVLGTFDALALPALDAALEWNVAYLSNAVVLSVAPAVAADPADFNGNGVVDGEDLQLWISAFGGSEPPLSGDADGDLFVGGHDFLIWQQNLTPTATPEGVAAVPEPAGVAAMLLSLGVLWPLARRPRLGSV